MSSFILKVVAMVSMLIDHSGYVIFGQFSFFNYIGRIAFPIFAFGISEGYLHTRNLKNYFTRLGIFALVSQLPYYLLFSQFTDKFHFNIFFTLILGLLAITVYDKIDSKPLGLVLVTGISILATFLPFEYSWYGILLIFVFYLFKDRKSICNLSIVIVMSIYNLIECWKNNFDYRYFILWIFTLSSLIFINQYNGKKGKDSKYILYLFYPVHLILLYSIYSFLH